MTNTLSLTFKQLREDLGFTQKDLAQALGVSPVHVSYIENGARIPSEQLLEKIYALHQDNVPAAILALLQQARTQRDQKRKRTSQQAAAGNTLFQLKARGQYTLSTLKRLHKKDPQRLIFILGLYHLYRDEGRLEDADHMILTALTHIKDPADRKWLEAYHFQLEGTASGYERAFEIMAEALTLFDQQHPKAEGAVLEKRAELLFRLSLIHYDYGVFLFEQLASLSLEALQPIQAQFHQALIWHEQLQASYHYPFAQMDYASLHFWLGILSRYQAHFSRKKQSELHEKPRQYWLAYIQASERCVLENHRYTWQQNKRSLYSAEYFIALQAFVALACAFMAEYEKPEHWFYQGELALAQQRPAPQTDAATRYRYYYNCAHFYSLKAAWQDSLQQPNAESLRFSRKALFLAAQADAQTLQIEARMPRELEYLQAQYPQILNETGVARVSN